MTLMKKVLRILKRSLMESIVADSETRGTIPRRASYFSVNLKLFYAKRLLIDGIQTLVIL